MNTQVVNENDSAEYMCLLKDQAGNVVTALTGLTLSLIDVASGGVINSRDAQDILNNNDGHFYATPQTDPVSGAQYNLKWEIQPEDNAVVDPTKAKEMHQAIFHAVWPNGEKNWPLDIRVTNLRTIPTD